MQRKRKLQGLSVFTNHFRLTEDEVRQAYVIWAIDKLIQEKTFII